MPNGEYQQQILHPDHWGGAIELQIFAIHHQTEIVAFDYHFLREDVFGEGTYRLCLPCRIRTFCCECFMDFMVQARILKSGRS